MIRLLFVFADYLATERSMVGFLFCMDSFYVELYLVGAFLDNYMVFDCFLAANLVAGFSIGRCIFLDKVFCEAC